MFLGGFCLLNYISPSQCSPVATFYDGVFAADSRNRELIQCKTMSIVSSVHRQGELQNFKLTSASKTPHLVNSRPAQ